MIFLDFSGYTISRVHGYAKFIHTGVFDKKKFTESTLIHLGKLIKKHKQYGDIVVCTDSKRSTYWRTKEFKHYKANRNKTSEGLSIKEAETLQMVREMPNFIYKVIDEYFPYRIIKSAEAEADDIIATLVAYHYEEPHLIIAADGDFKQLQTYNVKQINYHGDEIVSINPELELSEKIIRGDRKDGIPNILSPNNSLVDKIKQKSITVAVLEKYLNTDFDNPDEDKEVVRRYKENKKLIDFSEIPLDVKSDIISLFLDYDKDKMKNKAVQFALKYKFSGLFENQHLFK